jgi:pyrophosphatase PpaX
VGTIVGADTCANAKPHPEPVLLALARLDRPPNEALMLGDSPHDLAAARAAGSLTVAALWGACGRDVLAPHADHLLEHLRDLPELVRAL